MLDIYEFIDSKDIREYNRLLGTKFAPVEQAAIIYHSNLKSTEEKLAAWKYLLSEYTEQQFEAENIRSRSIIKLERSFRKIAADTVKEYETALELRNQTGGVVYKAGLYESDTPQSLKYYYFSNYEKAFEYLRNEKQYYLNNYDLCNLKTEAVIIKVLLDNVDESKNTIFYFDNELRITDIRPPNYELGFDFIFINIPLPFKKGDIVRTISQGQTIYGVIEDTPDEEYFSRACDSSDMIIWIIVCDKEDSENSGYMELEFLNIELCSEDELPECEKSLIKFRKELLNV